MRLLHPYNQHCVYYNTINTFAKFTEYEVKDFNNYMTLFTDHSKHISHKYSNSRHENPICQQNRPCNQITVYANYSSHWLLHSLTRGRVSQASCKRSLRSKTSAWENDTTLPAHHSLDCFIEIFVYMYFTLNILSSFVILIEKNTRDSNTREHFSVFLFLF